MNELINKPTWSFGHKDSAGVSTIKIFEAESWFTALQEFVYFLRGTGHSVDDNAIQINEKFSPYTGWMGNFCTDIEVEEDWDYLDDSWNVPPFEGKPEDCAFKSKFNDEMTNEELLEIMQRFRVELDNIKGVQY